MAQIRGANPRQNHCSCIERPNEKTEYEKLRYHLHPLIYMNFARHVSTRNGTSLHGTTSIRYRNLLHRPVARRANVTLILTTGIFRLVLPISILPHLSLPAIASSVVPTRHLHNVTVKPGNDTTEWHKALFSASNLNSPPDRLHTGWVERTALTQSTVVCFGCVVARWAHA
jgi:hypothetical protein